MNKPKRATELPYEARARIADNVFLLRKRAGYSQEALGDRARVSGDRIGTIENGQVNGMLDTYVRLAGSLSSSLGDLLAGVTWTPGSVEFEFDTGYQVEFELEASDEATAPSAQERNHGEDTQ